MGVSIRCADFVVVLYEHRHDSGIKAKRKALCTHLVYPMFWIIFSHGTLEHSCGGFSVSTRHWMPIWWLSTRLYKYFKNGLATCGSFSLRHEIRRSKLSVGTVTCETGLTLAQQIATWRAYSSGQTCTASIEVRDSRKLRWESMLEGSVLDPFVLLNTLSTQFSNVCSNYTSKRQLRIIPSFPYDKLSLTHQLCRVLPSYCTNC